MVTRKQIYDPVPSQYSANRALICLETVQLHSTTLTLTLGILYLLFYCQKLGNEPDACKKCYGMIRIFTFLAAFDGPFLKNPPIGAKISQKSFTQVEL